ncbi:hypothetical protein Pmani_023929 [Petrolisthes manimaculis]|uniref:Uncharacterized protein n=1 Tax=Petrolisthes manimaculis TaxID=1843537 RepID=A0AAE1P9R0_9EUCA|nr:hypothetical protein Pmani_023929 [Petrolisthes manimaculis]
MPPALAGGGGARANQERGKEREGTPLVTSARPLHQLRPWITGFICSQLGQYLLLPSAFHCSQHHGATPSQAEAEAVLAPAHHSRTPRSLYCVYYVWPEEGTMDAVPACV